MFIAAKIAECVQPISELIRTVDAYGLSRGKIIFKMHHQASGKTYRVVLEPINEDSNINIPGMTNFDASKVYPISIQTDI